MNKPVVTLGIDSGSRQCGVAIYENAELIGTLNKEFKGGYNTEKLQRIIEFFDLLFMSHEPNLIILESPAPVRGSRSLTVLNQIIGAIIALATMKDTTVVMVHNKTAKSAFGVTKKDDAVKRMKEKYPIILKKASKDECDAVLMVEAYIKLYNDVKG